MRCRKHRAGVIIVTYEDAPSNWGFITGVALRTGLLAMQVRKKLLPIIAQYLTILFPPAAELPAPTTTGPTPSQPPTSVWKMRLGDLWTIEWQDEDSKRLQQAAPSGLPKSTVDTTTTAEQTESAKSDIQPRDQQQEKAPRRPTLPIGLEKRPRIGKRRSD